MKVRRKGGIAEEEARSQAALTTKIGRVAAGASRAGLRLPGRAVTVKGGEGPPTGGPLRTARCTAALGQHPVEQRYPVTASSHSPL